MKKNNNNTPAYQGSKLKAGYTWNILLFDLILFNPLDYLPYLPSSAAFLAFRHNLGDDSNAPLENA